MIGKDVLHPKFVLPELKMIGINKQLRDEANSLKSSDKIALKQWRRNAEAFLMKTSGVKSEFKMKEHSNISKMLQVHTMIQKEITQSKINSLQIILGDIMFHEANLKHLSSKYL